MNETVKEALDVVEEYCNSIGYHLCIVGEKNVRDIAFLERRIATPMKHENWYGWSYGKTKVREKRYEIGIGQTELSELIGVNQRTISRLEDDRLGHSELTLQRVADYFKCSVADLLVDEDDIAVAKKRAKRKLK